MFRIMSPFIIFFSVVLPSNEIFSAYSITYQPIYHISLLEVVISFPFQAIDSKAASPVILSIHRENKTKQLPPDL